MKTLIRCALLTAATALTSVTAQAQVTATTPPASHLLNVILIVRDQTRYDLPIAAGYDIPALDRLAQQGITFRNHYIASAMCTPSHAALWSGTPPQVNGVFDQSEMPWATSLRTDRPNMGSMMKRLGYRTAYYGKWEIESRSHPQTARQFQRCAAALRLRYVSARRRQNRRARPGLQDRYLHRF